MIRPIGKNVLLRMIKDTDAERGGIIIPARAQDNATRGVILAKGESVNDDTIVPEAVAVIPAHSGNAFTERGESYVIIAANKIMGVMQETD